MEPSRIELFGDITILLLIDESAARPPRLAAAAAGRLAAQLGATVLGASDEVADEAAWATDGPGRILLRAESTSVAPPTAVEGINVVRVVADPWHNEATLFAAAGLSELLGDPAGAPQVPAGQWGAMTVGYAVLAALASVRALALGGEADVVTVDCVDALRWVNWKAIALADLDRPITREGADSAWPILPCVDGHVALVHTPRDFAAIVAMVDDDRLRADRFARARDRATDPAAYLSIVAEWAAGRTRAELDRAFLAHGVPAAAVVSPAELVDDVMLRHRRAFTSVVVDGCEIPTPVAPVRVRSEPNPVRQPGSSTSPAAAALGSLPLAGVRVLDLGVLTAGAGTSSLLADLGAEVIK
ncbi:MAG: CoA transferase, partial [Actinomycetota bacterium]